MCRLCDKNYENHKQRKSFILCLFLILELLSSDRYSIISFINSLWTTSDQIKIINNTNEQHRHGRTFKLEYAKHGYCWKKILLNPFNREVVNKFEQ